MNLNHILCKIERLESEAQQAVNAEIKKICDKWGLKFYAGMGVWGFNFSEDTLLVEGIDFDGSHFGRELESEDITDSYNMELIKDSELSELYTELTTLETSVRSFGEQLSKSYEDWFLMGAEDYDGGFRYNNGYENPDRIKEYFTHDARNEQEQILKGEL